MYAIRSLKTTILGQSINGNSLATELSASHVPITDADCRGCAEPCDQGHEEYPRFDVDMKTKLLGSVKPYSRQVVISTGKADWQREVTEETDSLAAYLSAVYPGKPAKAEARREEKLAKGLFSTNDTGKIAILNGSHTTLSEDPDKQTVLIFPDYKVVVDIPRSLEGATTLWRSYLDASVPQRANKPGSNQSLKSWVIPYSCVILLCSHKRRDKRCHIASGILEQGFIQSLTQHGWSADTQLEDPSILLGSNLESFTGSVEEKDRQITEQLKGVREEKRALILKNSHVGGHKFAGNCIIYMPQGYGVWYGRVTAHEVEAIVVNTIEGGKVLPKLLRGGINLSKPGCSNLNDW
ncbi:hypothetical protein FISHEDRAFT_65516 [Fistulina hepatica ATCC 64428]|nr:hypothetical protein FISHEDRAFT_65516 [Fistulina hepatica ATCC 64428]